jgi:hypothetical protein
MELGRTDRIFLVARSARSLDPEPRSTRRVQKSCSISSRKRLVAHKLRGGLLVSDGSWRA